MEAFKATAKSAFKTRMLINKMSNNDLICGNSAEQLGQLFCFSEFWGGSLAVSKTLITFLSEPYSLSLRKSKTIFTTVWPYDKFFLTLKVHLPYKLLQQLQEFQYYKLFNYHISASTNSALEKFRQILKFFVFFKVF